MWNAPRSREQTCCDSTRRCDGSCFDMYRASALHSTCYEHNGLMWILENASPFINPNLVVSSLDNLLHLFRQFFFQFLVLHRGDEAHAQKPVYYVLSCRGCRVGKYPFLCTCKFSKRWGIVYLSPGPVARFGRTLFELFVDFIQLTNPPRSLSINVIVNLAGILPWTIAKLLTYRRCSR